MVHTFNCPHCNSVHFIKYGKYKSVQRYQCKDCLKTFNEGTGLVWHNTKKSTELWTKYTNLMLSGATIRECSNKLGICIETSFRWRHKILNHINKYTDSRRTHVITAMRHTKFKENFKGQKTPPVCTIKSRKNIFVTTTINKNGYSLAKVAFNTTTPSKEALDILLKSFNPIYNTYFFPGKDKFSYIISKKFNQILHKGKELQVSKEFGEELMLNCSDFILHLRRWLRKFRSVASKYLQLYLNWFVYIYEGSVEKHTILSNLISSIFCLKLI
ncbi:MAG: IS1/IS1595 family N-terminal zinc-binding domain-containing protein [Clostridium chrysemydis]|uniref:IS1/IS1595 family N-terminal zinc-binding domain-containing protein n=1 Tax=Clostridium chrysemydis TaxID=2665504 RepID=UPI003F30A525